MLYAVYLRTKLYGTTYAAYKFHGVGVFGSIEPHKKKYIQKFDLIPHIFLVWQAQVYAHPMQYVSIDLVFKWCSLFTLCEI